MRLNPIVRRLAGIGVGLTLLTGPALTAQADNLPPAAASARPTTGSDALGQFPGGLPPLPKAADQTVITISDTGFDAPSYTVAGSAVPSVNVGTAIFKNVGTKVHSATLVSGQFAPASLIQKVDGAGGVVQCFQRAAKCGNLGPMDTGGIDPGGSATVAFGTTQASAAGKAAAPFAVDNPSNSYVFTSAPDCLRGNNNPQFNCTPSTITLKSVPPVTSVFGQSFVYGSANSTPDDPNCAVGSTVIPANGTAFCHVPYRHFISAQGSPSKPLESVTITVDDIMGYQPTLVWVKMGGTITWVNKGANPHTMTNNNPVFPIWNGPFVGLGGQTSEGRFLNPGETFTWNTPTAVPLVRETQEAMVCSTCAVKSVSQFLISRTPLDIIAPQSSGFFTASRGVCLGQSKFNCGVPAIEGIVTLVAQ